MSYFVKPSSDIFVKFLFGSEENSDILLEFINAVLTNIGFDKITSVEIKNPFNIKDFVFDKETILDVKATDEKGRIYDIEIQSFGNDIFINRSLYYWSKLYSAQLNEAEVFKKLKPVICINILDFELFDSVASYFNSFLLKELKTNEILTDHLSLNFIELPKLIEINKNNELDKLSYFLKKEGTEDSMLETLIKDDSILKKAHNQYERFTSDDKMRELYESHQMYVKDKNTLIEIAREEGELKGALKGKIEGKIEDARLMKQEKIDIKIISKITGLSIKEIEML